MYAAEGMPAWRRLQSDVSDGFSEPLLEVLRRKRQAVSEHHDLRRETKLWEISVTSPLMEFLKFSHKWYNDYESEMPSPCSHASRTAGCGGTRVEHLMILVKATAVHLNSLAMNGGIAHAHCFQDSIGDFVNAGTHRDVCRR
jgi:hypothetical protein